MARKEGMTRNNQQVLGCNPLCLLGLAGKPPKRCMDEYLSRLSWGESAELRLWALRCLGEPPLCCKCGESDIDVLCIDHKRNNGAAERRSIGNIGIYKKIIRGPPSKMKREYQILCRNCNWKKHIENRT